MWLWILLGVVGVFVVALLVMWTIGRKLPEEHVVSATVRLPRTCDEVWKKIADAGSYPTWAAGVTRSERLPDKNGHEMVRQWMGRNSFVLETTRSEPGRLLVRTIADDAHSFSGDWAYALEPDGDGCRLTLTEHGRVVPAIPRFFLRYLMNPLRSIDRHLASLSVTFGARHE